MKRWCDICRHILFTDAVVSDCSGVDFSVIMGCGRHMDLCCCGRSDGCYCDGVLFADKAEEISLLKMYLSVENTFVIIYAGI